MQITDLPFIIKNKYLDEYLELTSKSTTSNEYTEEHHIICKCFYKYLQLPVDNSSSNLVRLLFKDHCKAHWLLYKCTSGELQASMANAFISMIGFKATKDLLAFGLSEAEYIDLQEKVLSVKNSAKTSYWSAEEITFLKENYSSKGQRYCADNLGRSLGAISSKASELELKIGRFFSEEELNFLKNNYKLLGAAACAKYLGRSLCCVQTKASRLNLTEDQKYSEEEVAFLKANYAKMGPTWCAKQLNRPYENIKAYSAHILHIKSLPQGTPLYCPELDMTFDSIKDASIKLNMSDGVICQVVNKKIKSIHGLTFEKIDKEKYYEERSYKN